MKGAKFDFERVRLEGRDGRSLTRELVRHPGAVCVVPVVWLDGEAHVVLIRNDRFAVERVLWEIPAGTLEPGERPEGAAARELAEETGYEAGDIVPLAAFFTTPGMTDELMHAFAATRLREVGQRLEEDESIEVEPRPLTQVLEMIDDGELVDAKSIASILIAQRRGVFDG